LIHLKNIGFVLKKLMSCGVDFAGNLRWINAMNWSGQKGFEASPTVKFVVDGAESGTLNSHGPLSFLKVCLFLKVFSVIFFVWNTSITINFEILKYIKIIFKILKCIFNFSR